MPKRYGALPMQDIQAMIKNKFITGANIEHVSPGSLDLTITDEIYRLSTTFLPWPGETISAVLGRVKHSKYNPENPLEKGVAYLAKLSESLKLPEGIYGYCNPKSSTGRNDVHVRVVADCVPRYDAITPEGYSGDLWVLIRPRSIPILIPPGETLSQLRFFNHDTRFDELELQVYMKQYKLLWNKRSQELAYTRREVSDHDGSLILGIELSGDIVGWECIATNEVLDFSKIDHYNPYDFFRPVEPKNGEIHLKQNSFYILLTAEYVRVPPCLACEMVPMDERSGDFRTHYAGFIDPGWGYGTDGNAKGRPLVLEVRPFEDLMFLNKQGIAKIRFEHMTKVPEMHYDELNAAHYTDQTYPKLSKHFKKI